MPLFYKRIGEVIAFEHLGHRLVTQQLDGITRGELIKPLALTACTRSVRIDDAKELIK